MSEIFKIRNKTTGLFSTGGYSPHWNKKGKFWKRKSDLMNHINIVSGGRINNYLDAEVVVFSLVETQIGNLEEMVAISRERKRKKQENYMKRLQKWKEERELAELNRLKQKYEHS